MTNAARLVDVRVPKHPTAVVLVLHGGGSREPDRAVSSPQPSVLRRVPIAHRIALIEPRRLAVFRLLNSVRGWDRRRTPVLDVQWALSELTKRLGTLPIGLVGHSLGGRAALLSADQPRVTCVVALNPWVYPDDGLVSAPNARVLVVQGTADRIASPERSAAAAAKLRRNARSVSYVEVDGAKHAMLSRGGVFASLAADFTVAVLNGVTARTSVRISELVEGQVGPVLL